MSTRPNRRAYRARYVFPLDSPPVPDGVITVEGRRIVAIGENRSGQPPQDLGQVAVLPGLINAHTHLEFSDLAEPLGVTGAPFPDWIAAVVAHRRSADTDPEAAAQRRRHATQQGLSETAQRGVTALGEIATGDWPADLLADSELDCTVFLELLGLSEDRVAPLLEQAARHLDRGASQSVWRAGLSPHAPYTVHPRLLEQAVALSAARQVPLAMHLAESFEELELLRSASGPLRQLLADLGAWDPTAIPRGIRPGDYLQILARAHRALVIHGNFLTGDEIGQIAAARDRLSVVYCPRTHARFVPGKYPLAEMLAVGVRVALGTDSRASNPDLHLWEEMRWVYRHYPEVAPEQIVRMGTVHGARALGVEAEAGTLAPGKRAGLAVIPWPTEARGDPYEVLLAADNPTLSAGTWVAYHA